ncbi:extracellular superoxide dismutase [Cu-Zn] isoform X2 [Sapajus apella]|uniref:Extracellular superoxide dismutase [Cu-Zn] isoform X2 n=1 Tax=Sapajus apella TaxID=9515 RepID=A0A6J3HHD9_SAPAP|nr:extracellular superoxide dismutase [Cu-Zn] isoform X2 [Sapajus apella]
MGGAGEVGTEEEEEEEKEVAKRFYNEGQSGLLFLPRPAQRPASIRLTTPLGWPAAPGASSPSSGDSQRSWPAGCSSLFRRGSSLGGAGKVWAQVLGIPMNKTEFLSSRSSKSTECSRERGEVTSGRRRSTCKAQEGRTEASGMSVREDGGRGGQEARRGGEGLVRKGHETPLMLPETPPRYGDRTGKHHDHL